MSEVQKYIESTEQQSENTDSKENKEYYKYLKTIKLDPEKAPNNYSQIKKLKNGVTIDINGYEINSYLSISLKYPNIPQWKDYSIIVTEKKIFEINPLTGKILKESEIFSIKNVKVKSIIIGEEDKLERRIYIKDYQRIKKQKPKEKHNENNTPPSEQEISSNEYDDYSSEQQVTSDEYDYSNEKNNESKFDIKEELGINDIISSSTDIEAGLPDEAILAMEENENSQMPKEEAIALFEDEFNNMLPEDELNRSREIIYGKLAYDGVPKEKQEKIIDAYNEYMTSETLGNGMDKFHDYLEEETDLDHRTIENVMGVFE